MLSSAVAAALYSCTPSDSSHGSQRVLLITIDDVSHGQLAAGRTPAIDDLAGRGATLTRAYGGPNCSNARAKWMSGCYTFRPANRVFGILNEVKKNGLPTDTAWVLPRLAPGSSALIGKHHLAPLTDTDHPLEMGFTHWSGSVANLQRRQGGADGEYDSWWRIDHDGASVDETAYATTWVADEALRHVARETRLVVASFHAVHKPLHEPPQGLLADPGAYDFSREEDQTLAMLEALDHELGRLAEVALAAGYAVLVASDNGGSREEGGKVSLYEPAIHVPLVVAGVEGQAPGAEVDALVDATDLHATVAELLGATTTGDADGVSFVPALRGEAGARSFTFADHAKRIGSLPEAWDRAVVGRRFKLVAEGWDPRTAVAAREELFDLEEDPGEQHDLAADPAARAQRDALREALKVSFA